MRCLFRVFAVAAVSLFSFASLALGVLDTRQVVGTLEILWGDPLEGLPDPAVLRLQVRTQDGEVVPLDVDGVLPRNVLSLNGRRVEVAIDQELGSGLSTVRYLRALPIGEGDAVLGGAVTGSQPWVSILCKFAGVATEPEPLSYFQNMYGNTPGGLDHYWREQSYDIIDVVGSQAFAWVTLPLVQTGYIPTPGSGSNANLNLLFDHCTAAADPLVDFTNGGDPYVGINMMFNGLLDCCAWGGGRFATLDGISKSWRTTWNPPWSFADEGVIAHEMGHGFGLPHSNNFDGDSSPYDSHWDMMSSATGSAVNHGTYGRLGKHTSSYHKDRLAWIAPGELFEPTVDGSYTVTLDQIALASTPNYRMARLTPPVGNRYYTVEARKRVGQYDGNLPGAAVIISEIDSGRSEPAWVVDADIPPANVNTNEGSMWKVGETFFDPSGEISVEVLSETSNGFVVRITLGEATSIFEDGFESGNTSAW
jgi:hypothetical protein